MRETMITHLLPARRKVVTYHATISRTILRSRIFTLDMVGRFHARV